MFAQLARISFLVLNGYPSVAEKEFRELIQAENPMVLLENAALIQLCIAEFWIPAQRNALAGLFKDRLPLTVLEPPPIINNDDSKNPITGEKPLQASKSSPATPILTECPVPPRSETTYEPAPAPSEASRARPITDMEKWSYRYIRKLCPYDFLLSTPQWKECRNRILLRDGLTCRGNNCQRTNKIMQVHHRYYVTYKLPWEYDDDAFITLCEECHSAIHASSDIPIYEARDGHYCKVGSVPAKSTDIFW